MRTGESLVSSMSLAKERHISARQRLRHPTARIPREQLHRVAAHLFRNDKRVVHTTLDGGVETDSWSTTRHTDNCP